MDTFDLSNIPISLPPIMKKSLNHEEIHLKAYKDATFTFFKQLYLRQHVANWMENGEVPILPEHPMMNRLIEQARDCVVTKPPYILLTVNAQPGITYNVLKTKVEKFVGRNIVQNFIYAYEVRRKTGEGLHCHILLKYSCKPYDFRRSAKSTFKSLCQVNNPDILNFKFVSEEDLQSKISYILGNKQAKKSESLKIIKAWREANNIPHFLESNPIFPCRVALKALPPPPEGGLTLEGSAAECEEESA